MAYPSDLTRTKNWGSEILTDSDLEGQFDLIINWLMAALNSTTGHTHDGTSNQGPKISASVLTISSQAQGDLLYASSASAWERLGAGTSGQYLKTQGAGANPTWADVVQAADQTAMEAASSTTTYVSPGRTHNHPGVAKAWVKFDGTGSSPITFDAGYGISGTTITKDATGTYTITWGTAFSSANYCVVGNGKRSGGTTLLNMIVSTQSTTACQVVFRNQSDAAEDTKIGCIMAFGDQ